MGLRETSAEFKTNDFRTHQNALDDRAIHTRQTTRGVRVSIHRSEMRALCLILLQCMLATEALPDKPETPKNESFATTPEARDKETCVDDEDHQVRQGGDSSTPNSGKSRKAHRRSRTRDPGRDASQKGKSTRRQSDSAAVASPSSNSLNGHQCKHVSRTPTCASLWQFRPHFALPSAYNLASCSFDSLTLS